MGKLYDLDNCGPALLNIVSVGYTTEDVERAVEAANALLRDWQRFLDEDEFDEVNLAQGPLTELQAALAPFTQSEAHK